MKLSKLDEKSFSKAKCLDERARSSYVSAVCRPESSFCFCFASHITQPNVKDLKQLNKVIYFCRSNLNRGLKFVPLDLQSLSMAVFIETVFAINRDMSSQLGFVVVLMNKYNRANIVQYVSRKAKRMTKTVLASKLFSMVDGFYVSFTIRLALNGMLCRVVSLHLYANYRSLYGCLTRTNRTT